MVYVVGRKDVNRPKAWRSQTFKLRPYDGRNRKAQPPDSLPFPGCALYLLSVFAGIGNLLSLAISFQILPPSWGWW